MIKLKEIYVREIYVDVKTGTCFRKIAGIQPHFSDKESLAEISSFVCDQGGGIILSQKEI